MTLPEKINDMYDDAMERILEQEKGDSQLAENVLTWILFTRRPLRLDELQSALNIQPGSQVILKDSSIEEDILVSVCGGLVTVDQYSQIISLVHYTSQEYFERIQNVRFPNGQSELATVCLSYLVYHMPHGLLHNYAIDNWAHHARNGWTGPVEELALAFTEQEHKVTYAMFAQGSDRLHDFSWKPEPSCMSSPKDQAMLTAVFLNLDKLVGLLLKRGAEIETRFNHRFTDNGKRLETRLTGFLPSAMVGRDAMAQLMVEKDVSVSTMFHECWHSGELFGSSDTPLTLASVSGKDSIVRLLIEIGADITAEGEFGSALHAAVMIYNRKIVEILLNQGANINAKNTGWGQTPLHLAVKEPQGMVNDDEHMAMVEFLLCKGANANLTDKDGRSPLQLAFLVGQPKTLQILWEWHTNKGLKDGCMGSVLQEVPEGFPRTFAQEWSKRQLSD